MRGGRARGRNSSLSPLSGREYVLLVLSAGRNEEMKGWKEEMDM
jgi:hypothetical protein